MFRHQNFENRTRIEGVMAMTIKTLKNTQCRQHLWSGIGLCNGDFDCHGHNSLISGPIFKILVPKHISCWVRPKKVMSSDFHTLRGRWQPQSASEVIQLYVLE